MEKIKPLVIGFIVFFGLLGFGNSFVFAQSGEAPMPSMPVEVEGGSYGASDVSVFEAQKLFEAKPILDIFFPENSWKRGLADLNGNNKNLIALIVKDEIYMGIRDGLVRLISDLQDLGFRVYVETVIGGKPSDLRERLRSRLNDGLAGAILFGSGDPLVAWFEMSDDFFDDKTQFPFDIFFMNLSEPWLDSDGNGIFDGRSGSGDLHLDIWVGRMSFGVYGDEVADINLVLDKTHQGLQNFSNHKNSSALVYADDDWSEYSKQIKISLEEIYPQVDLINDPLATTASDYLRKIQEPYDFITVWAHSDVFVHSFKPFDVGRSWVESNDIINASPRGYFYNLYACSTGNYTGKYKMSSTYIHQYIGGAYLSGNGLVAIAPTKTGGMAYPQTFYKSLSQGKNFGDAFIDWWNNSGFTTDQDKRRWNWGMVILGIPILQIVDLPKMNISANVSGMTVDVSQNLTVTVTAENGSLPMSGTAVSLSGAGVSSNMISDSHGQVTFKKITPLGNGNLTIQATKDGYRPAEIIIPVKMAEFKVTVSISGNKTRIVRVTVKNSVTNKAVSGATVSLSGPVTQTLATSSNGQVSLRFSGTGQLTITISKKGYLNWSQTY